MIKLSICIPTYNYGEFIEETLDSILPQLTSEVEVVILDGGSTDDTRAIVEEKQEKSHQIKYVNQNFRGGIDRDIEKVISLSQGQYCWLFSADDIMLPGAVNKVLRTIKSNYDVYICEHTLCDINMNPVHEYPPFNDITESKFFDLKDDLQKREYFRLARTSEAFFSFLAGSIFKRESWDSVIIPESFRDTCWIVAGHLLSKIKNNIKIEYMGEALLYKREGNDSFSNGSMVNRCKIGIENFQHISNEIFGRTSEEAFHIRRVLQRDIPLRALLFAKMNASIYPEKEDIVVLRRIVKMHYFDKTFKNFFNLTIFTLAHPKGLKFAFWAKKNLRKFLT